MMDSSSGNVVSCPQNQQPFSSGFAYPISNNMLHGVGQLTWLSPKAGLITCSKPGPSVTVSFQLKDFCDAAVTDLTLVLRVGFQLAFRALSPNDNNEWIANFVGPVSDTELSNGIFDETGELNLESVEHELMARNGHTHKQANKDPYSIDMENESISFLISIFQKNSIHYIPLSSLHSRISNSGKEDLYRYIGSSSLKRRQFIERRSYIFHISENDMVFLQPPEIYMTVCILSGFLLSHGGVTSSETLFNYFLTSPIVPVAMKENMKNNRTHFMNFLMRHPFAFSPFPSQCYVSVRRNLPYFDYSTYLKKYFPQCVFQRPTSSGIMPQVQQQQQQQRGQMLSFGTFDHGLNDAGGGVPPGGGGPTSGMVAFHTPTTPVTPLFQEDPLIASQKAARAGIGGGSSGGTVPSTVAAAVWSNSDFGFFDQHGTPNALGGVKSGPSSAAAAAAAAAAGLLPPGAPPIIGRAASAAHMAAMFGVAGAPPSASTMELAAAAAAAAQNHQHHQNMLTDFAKVDVSRRPTDLSLALIPQTMRKSYADQSTQTESENERGVGRDARCRCKCTCQGSSAYEHRRQSSTESLNMSRTNNNQANSHHHHHHPPHQQHHHQYGEPDSFYAAMMRQRPVSVQGQLPAITNGGASVHTHQQHQQQSTQAPLAQRPLFDTPLNSVTKSGDGLTQQPTLTALGGSAFGMPVATTTATAFAGGNTFGGMARTLAGASSSGTTGASDFDALQESFFNHTLNSFATNFMGNGAALMNGEDFLGTIDSIVDGNGFGASLHSHSSFLADHRSMVGGAQQRGMLMAGSELSDSHNQADRPRNLPMPIGVHNHSYSTKSGSGSPSVSEKQDSMHRKIGCDSIMMNTVGNNNNSGGSNSGNFLSNGPNGPNGACGSGVTANGSVIVSTSGQSRHSNGFTLGSIGASRSGSLDAVDHETSSVGSGGVGNSSNSGALNSVVTSHYDPFGSGLSFNLPSISSLKL